MSLSRCKTDKEFVRKVNEAIQEETYDDLDMDEWEIIEKLILIIEAHGALDEKRR